MEHITTRKGIFLFIEVPNDAINLYLTICGDNIHFHFDIESDWGIGNFIILPMGKYRFICTTKNATEEHAAMFGICAITKDGTMYKYGVVADDGFPAAMDEDGWVWSEFELTLQGAINKFLKQNKLARKNNYAIIQKL